MKVAITNAGKTADAAGDEGNDAVDAVINMLPMGVRKMQAWTAGRREAVRKAGEEVRVSVLEKKPAIDAATRNGAQNCPPGRGVDSPSAVLAVFPIATAR